MEPDTSNLIAIQLTRPERYRHYAFWAFIWWFMVSAGLDDDWPAVFSLWTQSPYVVSYAILFYATLLWAAPMLHKSRLQFAVRKVLIVVGYTLVYMGLNRVIPEWENGSSIFYEYTLRSEVEESVVMLIFIWIPAYGLYYHKIGIVKVRKAAEEEVKLAHAREYLACNRLKLYKSDFNAHLTFNTLSLIYTRALHDTQISEPILLLSDILRYNTTIEADRVVALSTEITHLRNFIKIHQIIYPDIAIEFSVNGEVDHLRVLPRIFVNFVENAVKHGAGDNQDFPIQVTLDTEECIDFKVRNKKGIAYAESDTSKKGHQITVHTLEAFYGDQFDLKITEDEDWYQARLKIVTSENKLLSEPAT